MKRAIGIVGIAVAAVALAAVTVQGARGRGVAINENGVRAQFELDVKKVSDGEHFRIGGPFRFHAGGPNNAHSIEIYMPECRVLEKAGNVVEFGGPARAVFMHGGHRVVKEGGLHVRVADRRNRMHPHGDPDQLGLRFFTTQNVFTYDFAGLVHDGDIEVYERSR